MKCFWHGARHFSRWLNSKRGKNPKYMLSTQFYVDESWGMLFVTDLLFRGWGNRHCRMAWESEYEAQTQEGANAKPTTQTAYRQTGEV